MAKPNHRMARLSTNRKLKLLRSYMKKIFLPLIIGSFLNQSFWLQSQDISQEPVMEKPVLQNELEASIEPIKPTKITLKQYALTEDFRLIVQKPLIIDLRTDFLPSMATIHSEMNSELNQIVKFLEWRTNFDLEIVPRKDSPDLGQSRVASIKSFLVEEGGISSDRIKATSEAGYNLKESIQLVFTPALQKDTEQQVLRFGTEISYSDSIPLNQVRLHTTIPKGWAYLENTGVLAGAIINPAAIEHNQVIWDLGDLSAQNSMDLKFGLVPIDHTQLASISVLKSYLEYTYPNDPSAKTNAVNVSISTKVEEIIFRVIISGATFDVNSWVLKPEAAGLLSPLGNFLSWQPEINITISGFSDNRGKADWNQELSENRAGAARDHLAQFYGVSKSRVQIIGYGPQFPVESNLTGKGRALNRRVEFTVKTEFEQAVAVDVVVLADSLNHEVSNPTVVISSPAGSLTNMSPIPISVYFSESVTGFNEEEIAVENGSLSHFSGSGTSYTFDLTPLADGRVTLDIPAGAAQDADGENSMAATQLSTKYDGTAPSVTILSSISSPADTSIIPFTVIFSENVTGFLDSDVTVGNGVVSNFRGSGSSYSFDVTPLTFGAVTLDVAAGVAQDAAGNDNLAATQFNITYGAIPISIGEWLANNIYMVGGTALVLAGAGYAILAAGGGASDKIGLPPDWPNP